MITNDNTTLTDSGLRISEASTLGLKPSEFPAQLDAAEDVGNGRPFIRKKWDTADGDLIAVEYWQAFGSARLRVFND